ncbi:MAG TPA: hypothetical protein VHQ47_17810 [Phycisphaerae bacterium]|nr:hypothetical protein [Phycisphaerae bacterium]
MPIPDNPSLIEQLAGYYEDAAARLSQIVISPPGRTAAAQEFNHARAAQQLAQVNREIFLLRHHASQWTSEAITDAVRRGTLLADKQAASAGIQAPGLSGSFGAINTQAVEVLARDTIGDLYKAADSMGNTAAFALRKMAATGVTNAQVNQIIAGRAIIEGQPQAAVRELRDLLEKVHGKRVVIQGKSGPISFDTGYYAKMIATTKTREAVVTANSHRLQQHGIDLVRIVGKVSVHFCTAFLGHVYSISGGHSRYPALSSLPSGGPPFHPNCSKSTVPFIEGLSTPDAADAA